MSTIDEAAADVTVDPGPDEPAPRRRFNVTRRPPPRRFAGGTFSGP